MSGAFPEPENQVLVSAASGKERKERRLHRRFHCEAPATVRLITSGISLKGNIRDLSLTGCSIEFEQRFPLGLNARMEVLFSLHGLPVLVHGASRCIHSPKFIGIEFGELSSRKKEAITEIIAELNEKLAKEEAAEAAKASNEAENPEAAPESTEN